MNKQFTDEIWESYITETTGGKDEEALMPGDKRHEDGTVTDKDGKVVYKPKSKKKSTKKEPVKEPVEESDEIEGNDLLVHANKLIEQLMKDAEDGHPSKESQHLVKAVHDAEPSLFDPDTIRKFAKQAGLDEFEIEYLLPIEFQKEINDMGQRLGDFNDPHPMDDDDVEWDIPDENEPTDNPWEARDGKPRGRNELIEDQKPKPYTFESDHRPLESRYLSHAGGDNSVGFSFIGADDTYYYGEAEFEWHGGFYKAKYSGTSAAEEPDEEPQVDGIQVVHVVNQETEQEVDDATYSAVQSWIEDELHGMGWSMMVQMGWEEPEPDYDY